VVICFVTDWGLSSSLLWHVSCLSNYHQGRGCNSFVQRLGAISHWSGLYMNFTLECSCTQGVICRKYVYKLLNGNDLRGAAGGGFWIHFGYKDHGLRWTDHMTVNLCVHQSPEEQTSNGFPHKGIVRGCELELINWCWTWIKGVRMLHIHSSIYTIITGNLGQRLKSFWFEHAYDSLQGCTADTIHCKLSHALRQQHGCSSLLWRSHALVL